MSRHHKVLMGLALLLGASSVKGETHNNGRGAMANSGQGQFNQNQFNQNNQNQNQRGAQSGQGNVGMGSGGSGSSGGSTKYESTLKNTAISTEKVKAEAFQKEQVESTKNLTTVLTKGNEALYATIDKLNKEIKEVDLSKISTTLDGTAWNKLEKENHDRAMLEGELALAAISKIAETKVKTVYTTNISINPAGNGLADHGATDKEAEANAKKLFGVTSNSVATTTTTTGTATAAAGKTPALISNSPLRGITGGYNAPTSENRLLPK